MALDSFRRIDMKINRANDYQIETQFVKEGDYNGRELVVQITDAGEVKNQSGVSLNLGWRHDSVGNTGLDPFTVVDITKGIFKIAYPKEMLNAGLVTAVIQVVERGKITLTRNFKITVENNPIDEGAIVSENSFTALTEALVKVNDLEQNYAPRLNEVTTQLAQTENRMNEVSINPKFPPIPFMPIKSDANYYDEGNFRYYKDEAMTIPATDNTPSFQAMVNYVHTQGGGKILLPSGNYAFKSKIVWRSKVSLIGANKITTKLFAEGEIFSLIEGIEGAANGSSGDDPSVWFEGCHFENFTIDNKGLSYERASVDGKGIFILYMKRALFRDLIFLNTIGTSLGCDFLVDTVIENIYVENAGRNLTPENTGGQSGIGIGTSALSEEPLVVSNCFVYNGGNYGIFVETQHNPSGSKAKYAKIVNCHTMGNRIGFGNKGSGGTQFIGCSATDNQIHGFHLTQSSYGDSVISCITEKNGGDGIRIENDYLGDLEISNLKTNNNEGSGVRALNNIRGGLKNVRLSHIKAHKNGHAGVWTQGNTKNLSLSDIDVVNNGQADATNNRGVKIDGVNDILNMVNIIAFDDQEVQTQKIGVEISGTTTNYILNDINVVGYTQSTGLINKASLDSGTVGTIQGYKNKVSGTATLDVGEKAIYVNHFLGKIPTTVIITPLGAEKVWLKANTELNRIRIEREGTTGTLSFMYEIRL